MNTILPIYQNLTEIAQENCRNYGNYMNILDANWQNTNKLNPTTYKNYYISGPVRIFPGMQGLFNIWNQLNHHNNRLQGKNTSSYHSYRISIWQDTHINDKTQNKVKVKEITQLIKSFTKNLSLIFYLMMKNNVFSLRSGTKQESLFLFLLFKNCNGGSSQIIKTTKINKRYLY